MKSFYSIKLQKANRQHRCTTCNRVIEVGEEYVRSVKKENGEFLPTKKFCLSCRQNKPIAPRITITINTPPKRTLVDKMKRGFIWIFGD